MTVDQLQPPSLARRAETISQATAVEQARAVAEVAAAVRVAKDFPRDMDNAQAQMRRACSTLALAEKAFYAVPKRGTGPSVHLARELARCFGNVQHGIVELRRDDEQHVSEMQAFAWDVENNTRSVRHFIVPHQRMANGKRVPLTDLGDVVNNNNSWGGRAVREVIWTVLPMDFRLEAEKLCRETVARGNGQPLSERIAEALRAFERAKVTQAQLEARLDRSLSEWDEEDVASLGALFNSLRTGEITREEAFGADAAAEPPKAGGGRVTAAEIRQQAEPPADPDEYDPTTDPDWGQS